MRSRLLWFKLLLAALTLLFIWGNSMLPGSLSSRESRFVHGIIEPVAVPFEELLESKGYEVDPDQLTRKTAHFAEYLALGFFVYILLLREDGRGRRLASAGVCLAAAMLDEGIQVFSRARGPSVSDVALDFLGSLTGVLLAAAAVDIVRAVRRKKHYNKRPEGGA